MESTSKDPVAGISAAGLVTALGGLAAAAGALLVWISVDSPRLVRRRHGLGVRGIRLVPGQVALAAGIVLIIAGVALWAVRSGEARRWWSVIALAAGAVVLGVTIGGFQTEGLGLARLLGGTIRNNAGQGRGGGRILSLFAPSHGPGLYIALAGGIVAVAGGVAAIFWSTIPAGAPPKRAESPSDQPTFSKGRAA
jgi:hypothetical protein